MKVVTERCVICREPVQYEGDIYCYRCGLRSELDDMRQAPQTSTEGAEYTREATTDGALVSKEKTMSDEANAASEPTRLEIPACAAIKFSDGVIIAGRRHDVCIKSAVALELTRRDVAEAVQGFMTTNGRFVDRCEAMRLAVQAGWEVKGMILFSEDLY